MADGTIYIDTSIQTDGVEAGSKRIETALKNTAKTVSNLGDSMSGYSKKMIQYMDDYMGKMDSSSNNAFLNEIEQAKAAVAELENSGKWFGDAEYDDAILKLENIEQAVKDYKKELISPADNANPFATDSMSGQIVGLESQLERLKRAGKGLGDKEFDAVYIKLVQMKAAAKQYAAELAKTPEQAQKEEAKVSEEARIKEIGDNAKVSQSSIIALNNELANLKARQEDLKKAGLGLGYEEFDQNAARITQVNNKLNAYKASLGETQAKTNSLTSSQNKLKSVLSGIGGALKKAVKNIGGMNKSTKGINSVMDGAFKKIMKYGFGIISLTALFRKMRSAIKDGLKNLAQFDKQTNTNISSMMSSLTQLKNSLATAFAPILTVVAPIINSFIGMITKAVNSIGMFFAALTGKSTYTKAVAVQEDYAASLSSTADSAKDAKKAMNQYLSPLDEITRYEEKDSDTNVASGTVDPSKMFEQAKVESSIAGLADKIKRLFEAEDWNGLGSYVASTVNGAFGKLYDTFNWANIGPKVTSAIKGITTTINSLVSDINWGLIGQTIGAGANSIIYILTDFITSINWKNLGAGIGDWISGLVHEFDFAAAGRLIGEKVKALFDLLIGLIKNIDWQAIGNGIADFVGGIDWGGVLERVVEGFMAVISGLAKLLWGLIEGAWNEVVKWWNEAAYEDGEFTIMGLLEGIYNVMRDIKKWVWDHIFTPFINGFKELFGIHSPSTVMDEMGGFLMEGLFNGISSLVSKVVGVFTKIKDGIAGKWEDIKTKTSNTWKKITSNLSSAWKSTKEDAADFGDKVKDKVGSSWENLKSNTQDVWKNITSNLSSTWNTAKQNGATFGENVRDKISSSWQKLKENTQSTWSNVSSNLSSTWNTIKQNGTNFGENVKSKIVSAWNSTYSSSNSIWGNISSGMQSKFGTILTNSSSFAQNVSGKITDTWNQMKTNIVNIWSGIANAIKSPINNIISVINKMINGVVNGINNMIRALNGLKFSVPKWVPAIGGNSFGLNIGMVAANNIPYLATGAVIPPNAPFTAMLGDQRHGRNLEAPESLIRQIVREEAGGNGGGNYSFVAQLNRRTLFEEFIEEAKLRQGKTGRNPFALGRA